MPLVICGKTIELSLSSVAELIRKYPHFKDSSKLLCQQEERSIGPSRLLYVAQRELAVISPEDDTIDVIGSDEATTCHIAALRHTGSGVVCVCHFDGCGTENGVKKMVSLVTELSQEKKDGRLELHLAGGFCDDRNLSEDLSISLLGCFQNLPDNIHLEAACITDLNTVMKNGKPYPVVYGIGVNIRSGEVFKAIFHDVGPDRAIRGARNFTGPREIANIYDHRNKLLVIGPYNYHCLRDIETWLQLPDDILLQHLSTSPEQEPENFTENTKATLMQMYTHPKPLETVFPGNKPHLYKKQQDGSWKAIER